MKLDELLSKILDISPDYFGVFDYENKLIFCNQKFCEIFGVTKDYAIGKTQAQLIRSAFASKTGVDIESEDVEEWIKNVESRQRLEPHRVFESNLVDGRWLKISEMVFDNDQLVNMGTDITDLKNAKHSLQSALKQLERLANSDELTGVKNRRAFLACAQEEISRSFRYKHDLSLILIDIDFFKAVNDTYGHASGDHVLKEVAGFFLQNLRDVDIFARIGGEEFVILLPETPINQTLEMANRIREKLAKTMITISPQQEINITVSLGISHLRNKSDDIAGMLERADQALYESKARGRNCCHISS